MIPHSRPSLGPEEEAAAVRVVRSGQLAQGPEVTGLEEELCEYLRVSHVVAVSSGTAALQLSLQALGLPRGAVVAMPSYVCAALLQATRHAGATPLPVDVDQDSLNLSPTKLRRPGHPSVSAVIVPHMFGRVAGLAELTGLGMPIIEDCAMALGATTLGRSVAAIGTAGVLSFFATKMVCAGEGGAVVTSDADLAERVRDMREYDGRLDDGLRYNYKMTDLQAAIARVQLGRLPTFIRRRRELADRYGRELSDIEAGLPTFTEGDVPFRYVIRARRGADAIVQQFESAGVAARRPVFNPIHRLLGEADGDFPVSTEAHGECVSIPFYPSLSDEECQRLLSVTRELL